jgi:hypothetical protein
MTWVLHVPGDTYTLQLLELDMGISIKHVAIEFATRTLPPERMSVEPCIAREGREGIVAIFAGIAELSGLLSLCVEVTVYNFHTQPMTKVLEDLVEPLRDCLARICCRWDTVVPQWTLERQKGLMHSRMSLEAGDPRGRPIPKE